MTCGVYDYIDSEILNLITSILIGHALYRIAHIGLEYNVYSSHYNTSPNLLFQISKHFKPNNLMLVELFFALNSIISFNFNAKLIIITFLHQTLRSSECSYDLIKFLRKGSGVDFATGMAANYFHGFLKIVLKEDTEGNSFKKRLENYEDTHKVKFGISKLFILIPRSCSLQRQFDDDWIEISKALEQKCVNRGGVKQRAYTVGVYRFKHKMKRSFEDESHYYVNAVSATPLLTFHEFLEFNPGLVPFKTEVLKDFVRELKKLISLDGEIRSLVEIVEFDDEQEELVVGQVLEQKVKAMWSKGYY